MFLPISAFKSTIAVVVLRYGLCPANDLFLARIFGVQVNGFLRGKYPIETARVRIVERANQVPLHDKSKMRRQIDGLIEFAECVVSRFDLIDVPRVPQGLACRLRWPARFAGPRRPRRPAQVPAQPPRAAVPGSDRPGIRESSGRRVVGSI